MSKILRGLRGATTAAANTGQAILDATAELLRALQEANGFQPEDVESAIFTSSPDLTAEYPARAARCSAGGTCPSWELRKSPSLTGYRAASASSATSTPPRRNAS